jgi:hypothetical protein
MGKMSGKNEKAGALRRLFTSVLLILAERVQVPDDQTKNREWDWLSSERPFVAVNAADVRVVRELDQLCFLECLVRTVLSDVSQSSCRHLD